MMSTNSLKRYSCIAIAEIKRGMHFDNHTSYECIVGRVFCCLFLCRQNITKLLCRSSKTALLFKTHRLNKLSPSFYFCFAGIVKAKNANLGISNK